MNLVVCLGDGGDRDKAAALSEHIRVPLTDAPGVELTLLVEGAGLSLLGNGMRYRGDFEQMLRRVANGHLQHEMLARAAKTNLPDARAVDATAGMGEDSLILASCGYEVTLFEQNPVIAALLRDTMERASRHPILEPIVSRMHLIEGNSISLLGELGGAYDLVYLDPMFPARQKSGQIHKKLQLIQRLEHPCLQEEELFDAAYGVHPGKIIVKRPLKGPFLAGRKPGYSLQGKAIRYDCYVPYVR